MTISVRLYTHRSQRYSTQRLLPRTKRTKSIPDALMPNRTQKHLSRAETEALVDSLARKARLTDALPPQTDFSDAELKVLQDQLNELASVSPKELDSIYLAFSAKHLASLVRALRALDRSNQPKAVSTYIQILSLLPDPKYNAYLRRYLRSPRAVGLPNLVTSHVTEGISWMSPSCPGHVCTLLIHLLFWCDTQMGDDKRASIDKALRDKLATMLVDLSAQPDVASLERYQRIEIDRLAGILNVLEQMPEDYYLRSSQDHLQGQVLGQDECIECMDDDAGMLCSQCKSVRYCSKECQMKAWKGGHKRACWKMLDEDGHDL